jgi:hypothetical protein
MEAEMSWEEAVNLASGKDKDDTCIGIFHMESMRDEAATEEKGKPIFANIPYVKIISPGNNKEIIDRVVLQRDKDRFPREWFKFTHHEEPEVDGTPVDSWPQVDKAQADTLKANNIFSVEQLSKVSDQDVGGLGMGMLDLKNKAKIWVDTQDGSVTIQKMAAKNRKQAKSISELEKKVAALEDILQNSSKAEG